VTYFAGARKFREIELRSASTAPGSRDAMDPAHNFPAEPTELPSVTWLSIIISHLKAKCEANIQDKGLAEIDMSNIGFQQLFPSNYRSSR
jgi:hypothetical protein